MSYPYVLGQRKRKGEKWTDLESQRGTDHEARVTTAPLETF